ncbi:DUF5694 domain-containing protein [Pedobacter aquatilis]|uniref:DUF5694 domain-containing protein n=1 Tax=Pedobacter aquatilis TaxID=351343 RepID=UPI0025B414F2|nr:DUF5694 domain-containing protein [Pedobacter aquatilis]MDN3587572.1 DUF5694 domain-containing protein [Pedobacter aquatilis]
MKYFFALFLLFSCSASAQKLEVFLIGVSHNYSKYPKQDVSDIYRKIERFKPDGFFGEFLSKTDEQNLMDYWCKKDNLARLQMLRKNRYIAEKLLMKKIDSLKELTLQQPENFQLKTDLAHAFYLNQDVSNAHYQYWQVFDALKAKPDAKLQEYVDAVLSPRLDTTGRSMRRLQSSEYALIAFPMMKKMGINELLAMDSQDYDLNWNASWAAFDTKFLVFRKDTSAVFRMALKEKLEKINKGFAEYDRIEKTSNKVTEWLNTPEASAISASGDFYLPEMYNMKGFPKEEMLSKIHWWIMRNEGMCKNVVTHSKAKGLKKVVVIAGANHRKYMQDIFEKIPGVIVKNLNEFK